uniref:Uncharacterized protein n=1 Tax=Panagrolaimus davidi TaxID=227884 RepID=A0A914QN62_9BILA
MPWRFTTVQPLPSSTPQPTTVTKDNLEEILQAIDTTSSSSSPAYKINNGSLSSKLNDTEVVVIENGTEAFRIIDDENVIQKNNETLPKLTTESATAPSVTPPIPVSTPGSPSKPFHRRLPISTTPKCEKLTEKQKYAKLESIGGRNQQFMANTPEEASKNFPHLIPKTEAAEPPKIKPNSRIMMSDAAGQRAYLETEYCDETCEEIRTKLYEAVDLRKKPMRNFMRLYDSGPAEVQEGKPENWKSGCYLGIVLKF